MSARPLLTFAVITYRQEDYAAAAAQGALNQTYAPLEILLSDDRSPDDTFGVLQRAAEAYRGPNRVTVRQTERNLGLIGHINDIMRLAQGELLIIAAGDDISLPQRAERIYEAWKQSGGRAHSLFSNAIWIDEAGHPLNPLHKTPIPPEALTLPAYAARRVPALVNGATHAWSRRLFEHFGPLPLEARAEDLLLPFRAALLGEIRYIDEPLVLYRRDSGRLKDAQGRPSLAQHRQRWQGWQELHAATYRARLRDLQTCLENGLSPHPPADLEFARRVTTQRLAEVEDLLAAGRGDLRLPPLRRQALRARLFFEPLFDFLRLNLYYRYQDLRRLILLLTVIALLALTFTACLPPPPDPTPAASPTAPPPALTAAVSPAPPAAETPSPSPTSWPQPQFTYHAGRLTVKTALLEMEIKDAAIVLLRDPASGETLLQTDSAGQCNFDSLLSGGFTSRDSSGNLTRACPLSFQKTDWTQTDAYHAQLTYQGLSEAPDTRLILDLTVDPSTGEILLQLTGQETRPGQSPAALNLALTNLRTPAVILGSGVKVERGDPPLETQTTEAGYGLYGVTMAVLEGEQASAAVWSESTRFAPEFIRLLHAPAADHLLLHSEPDPKESVAGRIVSPPWRIGIYPRWEQAARRWRQEFEQRTGARPLWENRAVWVRRVHAVFDSTNQLYEDTPEKYAELAALAPPECVLFYLWNGDRLILFGDHALAAGIGRPDPGLLQNIQTYGWPLLLYHPFNLIYTESGAQRRLNDLAARGWLPPGYQFTPDFPGAPGAWYAYWQNARGSYDETLAILHPAAPEFQRYLVQNFGNYARRYGASAAYLDVLGNDGIGFFPPERRLIDGQDYISGEISALERLAAELPQLAVMSEYQSPWLVPYAFYTWEGVETHLRQAEIAHMRLNHPLRAALLASYQWARETNGPQADDRLAALLGTLPQISLTGDYEVSDSRARWSQARAALFCQEELFHDLPERWDADALAYYRSQRTGHWFKLVRMGETYGYVEILPDGGEQIRLKR